MVRCNLSGKIRKLYKKAFAELIKGRCLPSEIYGAKIYGINLGAVSVELAACFISEEDFGEVLFEIE